MSFIANLVSSKTIWGIIVSLIGIIIDKLGWGISSAEVNQVIDLIIQLGGLIFAFYGRIVAKKPITPAA